MAKGKVEKVYIQGNEVFRVGDVVRVRYIQQPPLVGRISSLDYNSMVLDISGEFKSNLRDIDLRADNFAGLAIISTGCPVKIAKFAIADDEEKRNIVDLLDGNIARVCVGETSDEVTHHYGVARGRLDALMDYRLRTIKEREAAKCE